VHGLTGSTCRTGQQRCTASSLGLGARLSWGAVQWRFAAAQALQDGVGTRRNGWRSHVALVATF
jgi:hypothetical protein